MKLALLVILGALLVFGAVTLIALEGGEVVVLHTFDVDRKARTTRTWIADYQGAAYIEAANPERGLVHDIPQHPTVELLRNGARWQRRATILPQPQGHRLIRHLLREKYGWADRWIGMLSDTSRSIAIRLDPQDPEE